MIESAKYIDVHAHVNFEEYDPDREEVLSRAKEAGVLMINVGTTLEASKQIVSLSEKYDGVYGIVGLHPTEVTPMNRFNTHDFEPLVAHQKTVAVGECGIDVYRLDPAENKEEYLRIQEEDFRAQIALAVKYDKPIMIHARESYGKILEILKDCFSVYGTKLRGNAHFFAGSIEEAQAFLDLGFTISFTGVITFAKQYEELVRFVPLNRMLSETDCPFVAPVPFRGRRNEPLYVTEVVKKIAEIKGLEFETVRIALLNNAISAFKLQ
ncbi:MAG: TatD family deoxyribonuclease [Candidatus Taylorbacteria bacterium]|nr:TatD family deoxyribonuclease [Candidatus Taylorbacteria bacterium]